MSKYTKQRKYTESEIKKAHIGSESYHDSACRLWKIHQDNLILKCQINREINICDKQCDHYENCKLIKEKCKPISKQAMQQMVAIFKIPTKKVFILDNVKK